MRSLIGMSRCAKRRGRLAKREGTKTSGRPRRSRCTVRPILRCGARRGEPPRSSSSMRSPAIRSADCGDQAAARRGRPQPQCRARQPRQAQHRPDIGTEGCSSNSSAARTFPDQLPARPPPQVPASTSTTSGPSTRTSSSPAGAVQPARQEAEGRLHDPFWCRVGTAATITPPRGSKV